MPSKDGAAKNPLKLLTVAKSARSAARGTQRVGEVRELVPAGNRPSFSRDFLNRQRQKLMAKKDEILAMYKKDLQSGQESNDSPTDDIVDRANNAYSRELAFSISDNERELMLQIDQAIGRLDAGTYGYCLHTGHPIGLARLEAIPWAKYGVEAQEMLEKGLLSEA
jgi:DnaK suppressor protein